MLFLSILHYFVKIIHRGYGLQFVLKKTQSNRTGHPQDIPYVSVLIMAICCVCICMCDFMLCDYAFVCLIIYVSVLVSGLGPGRGVILQ